MKKERPDRVIEIRLISRLYGIELVNLVREEFETKRLIESHRG